jgi:predicted MFS family arabinose efflux permease
MVGLVLTGTGAGTTIFPPLANWLISLYHWRTSIAILGLVILIIGIILSQFIKRDPSSTGQQPDGEIGIVNIKNSALNKGYSLKEAIHTPQFWIAIIIFLCCGFFGCTVLVHIVPYAILYGISPTTAANMVAVIGGFSIIGGLCTGRMVDKIGIKKSLITFLSIETAALIWLIISKETWQIGLFAVIFGFAYGSIGVSEAIISIWLFGLKSNALILSLIDFGLTLGAAVGPVIAGYTFDITVSYQLAFVVTAVISVIALLLSIFVKPPQSSRSR